MSKKRRALILYATMTKNTEKIAGWFKETFEEYNWDVTMFRLKSGSDWEQMQPHVYFDDYDVVCLGSPIVAGYPLKVVSKVFSLGAHTGLEEQTLEAVDGGAQAFAVPDTGAQKTGGKFKKPLDEGPSWRRNNGPYAGVLKYDDYKPLGIVFTTYGGGFYGSDEASATLEILKLYLNLNNVSVIGRFACCGREFGPAGLAPGEKPRMMPGDDGNVPEIQAPDIYTKKNGEECYGSYFFHHAMWDKPGPREEAKAKALVADIVEDYFMTFNGKRNTVGSQYISIS